MSSLQGCIGESIFITECLKRNIPIYKPIADVYGVDFITGHDLLKIQVKTTSAPDRRYGKSTTFKIQCRHGGTSKAYENHFDFMAAYIMPLDIWYIIPIDMLNKTTIRVNPGSIYCKFNDFKESWVDINDAPEDAPPRD